MLAIVFAAILIAVVAASAVRKKVHGSLYNIIQCHLQSLPDDDDSLLEISSNY